MENQPRFDLNDALLRWRSELAGQPGVAAEDVRELETHLLESIASFQRRGLSQGKAFAKAQEKLGSAAAVGAEFAKAHTLRIWRDRVFWIAFLGFVTALYASAAGHPLMELARWLRSPVGTPCAVLAVSVLAGLPNLVLCGIMVSGHAEFVYRKCWWSFAKRWRLGAVGLVAAIAANLLTYQHTGVLFVYELGFLAFAVLVMPREIRAGSSANRQGLEGWQNALGVWRDRLFWLLLAHLAIGAWTMVISAVANGYILRLPESQRSAFPLIVSILFFVVWLGPMGVVGLGLWTGHLDVISRVLRSRWQVGVIAGGLGLIAVGAKFWLLTWNVSTPRFTAGEWKFGFLVDGVGTLLIGFVFVALMVWILPWRRQRKAAR